MTMAHDEITAAFDALSLAVESAPLANSVIDAYSPVSIIRRQRWARASALSRALSILGCGGAGTASESMVLRPPRIVNVIGTCTVIVFWSVASIAFTRRPFFALKPRAGPGSGLLALQSAA
jgi:hypothetical protein